MYVSSFSRLGGLRIPGELCNRISDPDQRKGEGGSRVGQEELYPMFC
jgi:hypothetical protein